MASQLGFLHCLASEGHPQSISGLRLVQGHQLWRWLSEVSSSGGHGTWLSHCRCLEPFLALTEREEDATNRSRHLSGLLSHTTSVHVLFALAIREVRLVRGAQISGRPLSRSQHGRHLVARMKSFGDHAQAEDH